MSLPPCWRTVTTVTRGNFCYHSWPRVSLPSIVSSTNMATTSLWFESVGIEYKPSIMSYTELMLADRLPHAIILLDRPPPLVPIPYPFPVRGSTGLYTMNRNSCQKLPNFSRYMYISMKLCERLHHRTSRASGFPTTCCRCSMAGHSTYILHPRDTRWMSVWYTNTVNSELLGLEGKIVTSAPLE